MDIPPDFDVRELLVSVRERDDDAFTRIVQIYTPMINKVISGFCGAGIRMDEAFAEACVGLYRAALSYDISQNNVTFGLYARICIFRRMCDFAGRDANDRLALIDDCDVDSLAVANAIESGLVGREVMHKSLVRAREILSDYEYDVFLLYLKGYKTAAIAERLQKSAKSVDNAKARLLKRLREESSSFPTFD